MDADRATQIILALGAAGPDLVREWCNCRDADIDAQGDIWIADPQAGHWLSADKRVEFAGWVARRPAA